MSGQLFEYDNEEEGILIAQAMAADESRDWRERRAVVDFMHQLLSRFNAWAVGCIKNAEDRVGQCPCCPLDVSICWMNCFREEGAAGQVYAAPCEPKLAAFFGTLQRPELEDRFREAVRGKYRLTRDELLLAAKFLQAVMDAGGWQRWQKRGGAGIAEEGRAA